MLNNENLSLEEKEWKAFPVKEVFPEIKRGHTLNSYSHEQGNLPYISATSRKNGIYNFINNNENTKIFSNCLTVANDGSVGVSFYHPYEFALSGAATILKNITFNKFIYLFLSPILNRFSEKYNYATKLNNNRLLKEKLLLPINKEGQPDYEYMEKYGENVYKKQEEKYKTYIQETLKTLQPKEIEKLEEKEWKEFKIKDVFSEIKRGKRLIKTYHKKGNIPYVSSTSFNNGIDNFISNSENVRVFSNCLTIANSGSVGACFYHRYEFIASDHVTTLKNNSFTMYVYLFVSVVANRLSDKYSFNREINDNRILKEKLLLPINKEGQPDFEYMEQYVKNIIQKKLQSVVQNIPIDKEF